MLALKLIAVFSMMTILFIGFSLFFHYLEQR